MPNPFHIDALIKNMTEVKHDLPILLANQAQRYFTDTFQQQGIAGNQWKEVQRRIEGTKEYKYPMTKGLSRRTSPILVRTGKMRRAVSNSIRNATFDNIRLTSGGIAYGTYHNDGTGTIPKRSFMKQTTQLTKKQDELILKTVNKAMGI